MKTKSPVHVCAQALLILLAGFAGLPARAQLTVPDGSTATVNGVSTNVGGWLVVGTNGPDTTLVITNGGALTNAQFGYVGYEAGSSNNRVIVTSAGSQLRSATTNSYNLAVGFYGSSNSLLISDGGVVSWKSGITIGQQDGSSNNTVTVSGSNSLLETAFYLYIGVRGAGNALILTNGGSVDGGSISLGYDSGFETPSSNNLLRVDGGFLTASSLRVSKGEVLFNDGTINTSSLLLTNTTGSMTFNAGTLITRGATISNGQDFVVGALPGYGDATWDVRSNATGQAHTIADDLVLGFASPQATLLITNGGTLSNESSYLGFLAGSDSNLAVVGRSGSKWITRDNLYLGYNGASNRLIINNGGYVSNDYAYVGYNTASSNNSVFLTVAGSTWETRNGLSVGYGGAGNLLSVNNGATVLSGNAALGWYDTSSNNLAVVAAPGSYWSNSSSLYVGASGAFNTLVVSNSGTVGSQSGVLGALSGSDHNLAIVTGAGSKWTNELDLQVGSGSSFNTLRIINGGLVANGSGYIGNFGGANSNTVLVSGSGSFWSNRGSVLMNTDGNRLLITNNGRVVVGSDLYVGQGLYGSNNLAHVSGGNSLLTVSNDVRIGDSRPGNALIVSNGALVSVEGRAFIGFSGGASNNFALISGANSRWTMTDYLAVGYSGPSNTLVISDGAFVSDNFGAVGFGDISGSNNSAWVTGSGSVWSNLYDLRVGYTPGNLLVITNGGVALSDFGIVGVSAEGSNNAAVVTGSGSRWITSDQMIVSLNAPGNSLLIANGAEVLSRGGTIGSRGLGPSNAVVVSGSGSLWSNRFDLYVGYGSASNHLTIADSAMVQARDVVVGFSNVATANLITVSAGTLLVTNPSTSGTLEIRRGTNLFNGGLIEADELLLTNSVANADGGGRFVFNGGTLITRTGTLSNGAPFVVGANPGSGPATWDVRSNATPSTVANYLSIGENHPGSGLLITNGGTLSVSSGVYVGGYGLLASNNLAVLSGAGSTLSDSGGLSVGVAAGGNRLVVRDGGVVRSDYGNIGVLANSDANVALVTGPGSLWTNRTFLYAGYLGSGNQLVVSNGGEVRNTSGILGYDLSASNNAALVTGADSLWTNSSFLVVGYLGRGNQLVVSNGGTVSATDVTVGYASVANHVTVDGGRLFAINASGTGALDIRRGTNLFNGGLIETDNLLITNTAGSMVFNGGTLIVRGGTVSNGQDFVVGASGTTPAILDVRSNAPLVLNNGFTLGANTAAVGNRLLITNGGIFQVAGGSVLGTNATASNNFAIISGAGSLWTNGGALFVGDVSSGNRLVVSNGAVVAGFYGTLGNLWTADNNVALVTGAGSLWTNSYLVEVGNFGSGNQLVVSSGGVVASAGGSLGGNGTADNNVALVTGAGSLWSNSGILFVGASGSGNQLVVSNGGTVTSTSGILGYNSGGSNNVAVVTGLGSLWTNRDDLSIGVSGSGNRLVVSNGGAVVASNLTVGVNASSSNNLLTVGNGTLTVANGATNGALDLRRGQLVFNGGTITTDQLLQTIGGSNQITFNAGTFNTRFTFDTSVTPFIVGNGTSNATFNLVGGGTHSFAAPLVISTNAALTGNGSISGTVTNFGTISAGTSPGSLRINGDLRLQSSSMMSFELGGLIATNQYDQVTITSFAELAGTLSLSLINGFLPDDSDTFTLLKFGSTTGNFTNVTGGRLSTTNNLASFAVTVSSTNFVLGGVIYTDSDGDGQGDLQEAAAGTDPLVSGSYLRIVSITRNGSGHYVIVFTSEPGKSYRVEWTDNLPSGLWNLILAPSLTTPGVGLSQWIDDGSLTGGLGAGTRTYRIGLQ